LAVKRFAAATTIRARTETVWALLTDAASYPRWNSTVAKIEGQIAANGTITVYAKSAPGRAFPLKITEFVPMRRMFWTGGMRARRRCCHRTRTHAGASGSP
jgi:uncharacterized protein YndB with AHSA1/START domain